MNGKEGQKGRRRRGGRGKRSRKKSKKRGPSNPRQSPARSTDSDSEDDYTNTDHLDNDSEVQTSGMVDFSPFRHGAADDNHPRFRSPGFIEDHQWDDRFTGGVSDLRARALTNMVENQMEKARMNILKKGVSDESHHLVMASERFHKGQRDRSRDSLRDRSRDRSPLDSMSQTRQNLEIARHVRRQDIASNFAQMRPEYDLEIPQGRLLEDQHELFSRRFLAHSPFQQDVGEESDQTFEQDFDEDSDQISVEDFIETHHTAVEPDFVETVPRYDLNLDDIQHESDCSNDSMPMVNEFEIRPNFIGNEQIQNVSFARSNPSGLQPAVPQSSDGSNDIMAMVNKSEIEPNFRGCEQMQSVSHGQSNLSGPQPTVRQSNTIPNVATNLQLSKIGTSNILDFPLMQSYGGIQNVPKVDVLPIVSSIPMVASMTQMQNMNTHPQMSHISRFQGHQNLEVPRPYIGGNRLIPGGVGNLLNPCIGGIPPRLNMTSNLQSPYVSGNPMMSNSGFNNFGSHPGYSTFGNPVAPGNIAVPQIFNNSGFAQNLNNPGMPQSPYNTGAPSRLKKPGLLPGSGKPGILPKPDVKELLRTLSTSGNQNKKAFTPTTLKEATRVDIKYKASMKCPVCPDSKSFENENQFRDHWRMFHIKIHELHYCPLQGCQSVANSSLKLREHFLKKHNEGLEEPSVNSLQKLCLAKKQKVNNPLFKDPNPFVYGREEKEETVVIFRKKCPVCQVSPLFKSVEAFRNHCQSLHTKFIKNFFCPNTGCKTVAASMEELKKHYWDNHNYGNDELTKATIETLEPKWTVVVNDHYIDPGKTVLSGFKPVEIQFETDMTCPICKDSEILQSLEEYQRHWQKYHVEYTEILVCPVDACKTQASNQGELRLHFDKRHKRHHPEQEASASLANARKEMKFNKHYRDPENCIFTTLEENITVTEFGFEEGMTCPVCSGSKAFKTENEFSIHWITHMKYIYEFPCPFSKCKTRERSIPKLKLHLSNDHTNLTGYRWKLDMVGPFEPIRSQNENYVDPGSYRYVKGCTKTPTGFSLDDKGQKVEIVFKEGFTCPVCKTDRTYMSQDDFEDHWKEKHIEFVDKHKCPVKECNASYATVAKLKEHYRNIHTLFDQGDEIDLMLDTLPLEPVRNVYVPPGNFVFDISM